MAEPLADRVIRKIDQATDLYYRLVILVASAGSGKTAALRDVHERTGAPLINVNLELSLRMLDLTERQRAVQLPRLLAEIADASNAGLPALQNKAAQKASVVLLDNIELLFDVSLKQDPLRLLQGLSRNTTVVAAWSGEIRAEGQGLKDDLAPTISRQSCPCTRLYLLSFIALFVVFGFEYFILLGFYDCIQHQLKRIPQAIRFS